MNPPLHLKGISKKFDNKVVLNGLNLDIQEEESFVLLGRSGAGKSVLLKCLLGIVSIDKGVLKMDGKLLARESRAATCERMCKIGMVFQGSALFDSLSVWENIAFGILITRQHTRQKAHQLALEQLERVGLETTIADLLPSEISGGMQRRVALARAIIQKPRFLFLDEPTAGLDPVFSRLISDLIQTCRKELKSTTFTITHDLHLARTIADRVGMIHEGQIVWQGTPQEMSSTSHSIVKEFVGSS